jgi:hypothetical protein
MLYLDMQFTWGSIGVTGATSETVRKELVYQIERISHHPSVVILDGCNGEPATHVQTSSIQVTSCVLLLGAAALD